MLLLRGAELVPRFSHRYRATKCIGGGYCGKNKKRVYGTISDWGRSCNQQLVTKKWQVSLTVRGTEHDKNMTVR